MRVFFDNCTSPVLAHSLNGFLLHRDCRANHIRDLGCERPATDIEWIAFLAESSEDWVIVTGDRRIQKNRAERLAFRQCGRRGFVLAPAYQKTPIHQQASTRIWRWPEIEGLLRLASPFLFELPISRAGKIRSLPL